MSDGNAARPATPGRQDIQPAQVAHGLEAGELPEKLPSKSAAQAGHGPAFSEHCSIESRGDGQQSSERPCNIVVQVLTPGLMRSFQPHLVKALACAVHQKVCGTV